MADKYLDVKGLNCPSPIIQAKRALNEVDSGGTLEIHSTDPASVKDFEILCRSLGSKLLDSAEEEGVFRFVIQKK